MVYILILMLIPASKIVGPFGGVGSPSVLFGGALFAVWVLLRVSGSTLLAPAFTPLHRAWLFWALAIVASYVAAMLGPISPEEMRGADRGLVSLVSSSGVFLLLADARLDRRGLSRVMKLLSATMMVVAGIALTQYLLGTNWYINLPFPGLTDNWELSVDIRSGLLRISGTAVHAIEYGVVQTMGFALALHWAFTARTPWARRGWWFGVTVIAITLPLAIARTPVVSMAVVALVLLPTWPLRRILVAMGIVPLALVAMRVAFPGVLGTVLSLFTWISSDPSTTGRTDDYSSVLSLLSGHTLFGRGVGTLLPDIYLILDNAYLGALLETGLLGLAAVVLLFATAALAGLLIRARSTQPDQREFIHAHTTGICVGMVTWGIFDGFGFRQANGVLVVLLAGMALLIRLASPPPQLLVPLPPRRRDRRLLLPTLGAGTVLAVGLAQGTGSVEWISEQALQVRLADPVHGLFATDTSTASAVITEWMRTPTAREAVKAAGGSGSYQIAQGRGSLAPATDRVDRGPLIRVRALAATPEQSSKTLKAALIVLRERLQSSQSGAPAQSVLMAARLTPAQTVVQHGARTRGLIGLVLLTGLTFLFLASLPDWLRPSRWRRPAARFPGGRANVPGDPGHQEDPTAVLSR